MSPRATIIVCTFNRAGSLGRTLRSIVADTSSVPRELLVVDNGSEHHVGAVTEVVEAARVDAAFPVRGLREPIRGKSRALNLGVREAAGDVLLFTDDDVEVADGWADALVSCFDDPEVGLAGGRTLPAWPFAPPAWISPRVARDLGTRDLGEAGGTLKAEDVIGANMAIRASALAALPRGFDPNLGPRAGIKLDYEELAVATQVAREHRVVYQPSAVVYHHVEAERLEVEWLRRMNFQRGFGWARYETMVRAQGQVSLFTALRRAAFYFPRTALLRARHSEVDFGPRAADREFEGFLVAGRYLGRLLHHWPGLARWAAAHLA